MISRRQFLLSSVASGAGLGIAGNFVVASGPQRTLALAGTSAPTSTCYARMFQRRTLSQPKSDVEKGLVELGNAMLDDGNEQKGDLPDAGYTYLGQFIDHDLTLDLTPLDAASPDAEHTPNFRTPFLDLDHLYGGGPNMSPFLYLNKKQDRGKERFLIGKTLRRDGQQGPDGDLPRNSQAIALTGDPRQDENLILAQLHVAFLKLHNCMLDKLESHKIESASPKDATLFEQARRLVTWHYQWIVYNEYLSAILSPEVFEKLPKTEELCRAKQPPNFQIPVEFNVAVFRFGHSMVRDSYDYNDDHPDVNLVKDLFYRTGAGGGATPSIPADWVISWDRFFKLPPETARLNSARKIDTKIAQGLYHLGVEKIKSFTAALSGQPAEEPALPVRTLLRGARVELASGQDAARAVCRRHSNLKPVDTDAIIVGSQEEILTNPKYGFRENIPLWYYILKEAEIADEKGGRLGPVGSQIVADVIAATLAADPESYVNASNPWHPSPDLDGMDKLLTLVEGDD